MKVYQVDAFTKEKFKGNPAAVCPLESWIPDSEMQNIAAELNLSETAFFVPIENGFHLRWFTPKKEVRLCGHATLATSHVLFNHLSYEKDTINFQTNEAGVLTVKRNGDAYEMDFPVDVPEKLEIADGQQLIDPEVIQVLQGTDDIILVVKDKEAVLNCNPDFAAMKNLDGRCVIVTAKDSDFDFVSRVFCPIYGIDEDPVTGSAHTVLTPYWSENLGKEKFRAAQISERGGILNCELKGDRVILTGNAVTTIEGQLL